MNKIESEQILKPFGDNSRIGDVLAKYEVQLNENRAKLDALINMWGECVTEKEIEDGGTALNKSLQEIVESGMGKCCTRCGCDDIQWEVDEEDECHDEVHTCYNCKKKYYDEDNLPYKLKPEVAELFLFIKSLKL